MPSVHVVPVVTETAFRCFSMGGYPIFFPMISPKERIMHMEEEKRQAVLKRLRRIEGQVRGLQRMVEEDRYCGDILNQIASAQKALRSVGKVVTRNHLETCVTDALRSGDRDKAEHTYDEVMDLLYKQIS